MFKVIDVFKIGDRMSVTLEGKCETLKNGSKLVDADGNQINVISVGTTRHENPADIARYTTILVSPCEIKKGSALYC